MTNYVAVTGPGTVWSADHNTQLDDITDGPENTILLIEITDSDIHWMEPRDITLEEAIGKTSDDMAQVPTSKHYYEGTYFFKDIPIVGHVVMADGSVRTLYNRPSAEDLAALLSIDGGESVDIDRLVTELEHPLYQQLRWDHIIGLPLFFISLVWFWFQLFQDSVKLKADQTASEPTD